ncbi:MAG: hypothetical protein O9303_00070 [Silanimonas sp.]|jgi:hypothetical protein|nr:hypothetical protein [Silanimonas sp.]
MLHHPLRTLFRRLIAAIRIERPWRPGLIRGGQGRLPKRIKRPKPALHSADAQRWIAVSRSVRRLLKKIAKEHTAHRREPPYPRTGDSA